MNTATAENDSIVYPITDYKIAGEGEINVLIIPCMSCRWRAFEEFMDRNANRYKIFAVTIPGHGGSTAPPLQLWSGEPVWQENALSALRKFIKDHEIDNAIVLSHSWGSRLTAQLLASDDSFARAWINLDQFVPIGAKLQTLAYEERLKTVESWRLEYMEPLRDPDQWAAFNSIRTPMSHERALLYYGMFMATRKDVLFQYWRENGLRDINADFSKLTLPILEVKSISSGVENIEQAKIDYLERYKPFKKPQNLKTIFLENTSHHQVEQRPLIIDEILKKFAAGAAIEDYALH